MSRADRLLRLAVATIAISPMLLAGCAALGVDRPKEPIVQQSNRPSFDRLGIAQLQYGNGARFQICIEGACPKPTDKTIASAAHRPNTDAVAAAADPPMIAAPSLPSKATLVQTEVSKPAVELSAKTVTITFASGAAMLTSAARKTLDGVVPDVRTAETIEIRGRTDESGSAQRNEVLARNRALAVRDYLHQKSLPAHTILRVSFKGTCCYVAGNDTDEGRAANRRVEVEFTRPVHVAFRSDRHDPS